MQSAKPVESRRLDALPKKTNNLTEPSPTLDGMRTSEIRYRRLFGAARDGILILNATTLKITDANPFMTELLDYSLDQFLGKELWEIGMFSDKEASQAVFRELQLTGYIRYEDLPLQTRDGLRREVEFVSNVYDEDGHHVIQCNIRDITERSRREEERELLLEEAMASRAQADTARTEANTSRAEADIANSIKDEFLAVMSHELRTPLTSILGWSNLLATGNLDEQATNRAVETIVRSARAQKQLIDDLLDMSRIVTGKLRLNVRPVELAPIIEAVVDSVRPSADSREIHLKTALESLMSPVSGDPDRIQQIIWNLLSNAIKFTPKGGQIDVRLERVHSHMEITISDTGQGIAPEFLEHIFERFRQSDSSSTRQHGGLGLGLSIVRQLVELHGGTVTAQSPGEGFGTIIRVLLPLLCIHQELSDADMTPTLIGRKTLTFWQPSLNDLRVLIVEDEPDARELVAAVLTARGAEVVSVGSAGEALEEMERQQFDVLVSDIGMPSMDGYALIERVRQLPAERGGRIPAAALTAYAGVEDRMRVLSSGYQMHIPKPVEPAELTTVVANLARRYATPAVT